MYDAYFSGMFVLLIVSGIATVIALFNYAFDLAHPEYVTDQVRRTKKNARIVLGASFGGVASAALWPLIIPAVFVFGVSIVVRHAIHGGVKPR